MASPLELSHIPDQIIAVGALGTAAFGLVDASKTFRGGISNVGFRYIRVALEPFNAPLTDALGQQTADCDWRATLKSHWINGRPKDEQKAIAVSLIQLGLSEQNAAEVAPAGQVDPQALLGVVRALNVGQELDQEQLNVLGRFKATIEARIDAAYERAEQVYRNRARAAAGVVSLVLALAAAWILYGETADYWAAALIGIVAVPLAPIAKDVASALTAAAGALGKRLAS